MSLSVVEASRQQIFDLLGGATKDPVVASYVENAARVWVGVVDGKVVCGWGLIPLTLVSNQAYLWLYTTEGLEGNEFVFIRRSRIVLDEMLRIYPSIIGHAINNNTRGNRWLRWLGAEFGRPQRKVTPFIIRRRRDG